MGATNEKKAVKDLRSVRYGVWNPVQKRDDGEMPDDDEDKKDPDYYHICGKAVVIGKEDEIGCDFDGNPIMEQIDNDAFSGTDIDDVVCNINHGDGNYAVARTRNKTLTLDVQQDGVYIKARLKKDNPRCAQFYKDVSEGLLDRMSFSFVPDNVTYDSERGCYHVKKVKKVYDVSAVEFPAYKDTSISESRSAELVSYASIRAEALKAKADREETAKMLETLAGVPASK